MEIKRDLLYRFKTTFEYHEYIHQDLYSLSLMYSWLKYEHEWQNV